MRKRLQELKDHQGFRKYFANTSWLFAEKILRMFVGLFIGVWVARYLGPEQFGTLSYAVSFVGLFSAFATLGLNSTMVRELIKHKERNEILLVTAFWLKLTGAVIVLLILALVLYSISNTPLTNILIFIIASATVFQSFNIIDLYFQSRLLNKYVVFSNFFSLLLSTLFKIVLILTHAPLVAFAWVILFDSIVLAAGYLYFFRTQTSFHLQLSYFDTTLAKALLKDSWPFMMSGAVLMIQTRIDQVMIKEFLNTTEVAYYSVAIRLVEAFGFIPMLLKSSLYPSLQNAYQKSQALYKTRLLNFYRLNFLLFLLVSIPLYLFANPLITLLYGEAYTPAGALLALMSIRLFFTNMGVARSTFILSENLVKYSLLSMILGTLVNIFLNYQWIPVHGPVGAIYATIVSFFVTMYVVDLLYSKTRQNTLLQFISIITFYKVSFKEKN